MIASRPTQFQGRVAFVKNLAGDYYHGRFQLEEPNHIDFIAGQYVVFQIGPPKLRHTLSIASSPSQGNAIEILQSVVPHGEGSKWLLSLVPGTPVRFLGPLGKFILRKDSGRPKVMVATACGISAIRAMLLDQLAIGTNTPVVLFWGLRYETDLFWQEELAALAAKHPTFRFFTTLSKPTGGWQGTKGRVTDHVVAKTKNLTESEFYLCGNREMIVDMRKQLMDNGVLTNQIFTETFF